MYILQNIDNENSQNILVHNASRSASCPICGELSAEVAAALKKEYGFEVVGPEVRAHLISCEYGITLTVRSRL